MRMRGTRSLSSVHSDHRPQSFSLWTGHGRELSLTQTTGFNPDLEIRKTKAQRTLVVVHAALTVSFRTANTGLFVVIHNTVSQVSPVSREAAYPAVAQQVYRLTAVSRCPIILLAQGPSTLQNNNTESRRARTSRLWPNVAHATGLAWRAPLTKVLPIVCLKLPTCLAPCHGRRHHIASRPPPMKQCSRSPRRNFCARSDA